MTSFQKLQNGGILLIVLSFTFIVLSAFSGNLVQPIYGANFGAAGDWGCTSNTDATVSNMDAKNPQVVFGLGDYSYKTTDDVSSGTSPGQCWFSRIDPEIDNQMKIAIGNHEDDGKEGFQDYMDRFGLSRTYYSYDQENVHVIVIDTDRNSFTSGSSQYNFVRSDLEAASQNPNIDWIIAYMHKHMYTSSNTCSSCSNTGSTTTSLRNTFHPLFDQYGVDLVLQGHVHNYQRTFPIKYDSGSPSSPTITNNNANTYTEGNGAVFAIVGTGGVGFHGLSGKPSFVSSQQDDFFGQLDIRTSNGGNTLEGKFYRNGNNQILDSFSITKAGNSPPVANNQAVNVVKNTPTQITLTATDANNDPLTYNTAATTQQGGTLSPSGSTSSAVRTYTPPNPNFLGSDSFTFTANDGTLDSNIATVSINVIEQPQGSYNYAPSFVATGSNYNDTPSSSSLQLSQFSVAAWFKTSTNYAGDAFIVNKGGIGSDSSGQNLNYGIWMTSSEQIKAGFETSSGVDQYVTSPNSYSDGQWHYAVVTNDGSTVRLYIDGTEVATKSTAGASPETSGTKPVRVGANSRVTPPGNFFTGEVDEVRVWSDDLTVQEVGNAFAGTNFNTAEQRLHLPFGASAAPPVANNQAVTVTKNTTTPITLTATDPNNDPLTYTVVTQPTHGTLTGTAPNLDYNPTTDYLGPDSFTFKANDGTADSNIANVNITVQEPGQGGYNYAPSFTATGSNYDETPSSSSLQLPRFTIAAWFNTNVDYTTEGFVVTKGGIGSDSAGNNMNYGMWMTSSEQLKGGFETATGADHFVTSTNTYNNGQWHYGTVTYDGSTVRLYVDGVQLGTTSTAGASPESSGTKPVRVGANSLSINKFFNGGIDEVRIWNRALSAQEVTDAFSGTFNTAGQVLFLPFGSSALSGEYNYDPSLSLSGPSQ